jgi:hypothetical protein
MSSEGIMPWIEDREHARLRDIEDAAEEIVREPFQAWSARQMRAYERLLELFPEPDVSESR